MKKLLPALFPILLFFTACKVEINPNDITAHVITFTTDKGETPRPIALAHGAEIKRSHLPNVTTDYFSLDGWYLDEEKIEPGYIVTSDLDLVAKWDLVGYEFNWTDVSDIKQIRSNIRKDLSDDNNAIKATHTSDTKSALNNWVLASNENGQPISNCQGFEAKIKFNAQMKNAGIQIYNTTNFDYYWVTLCNNGDLRIKEVAGDSNKVILTLKQEQTSIKINEWNNLKMVTTPLLDTEFYINGKLAYTISKDDLKITKGTICFAHQTASDASKETPAYAWCHLLQYQTIK